MARKVLNRKELRAANDAAEAAEADVDEGAEEGEAKPKKAKKAATPRKSRAKVVKEVRLKAFWDVLNQSMKRIARFEYSEKKLADKKAAEMTAAGKSQHFVQLVKEVIEE